MKLLASWGQLGSSSVSGMPLCLCSQALSGERVIPCPESLGHGFAGAPANAEARRQGRASQCFLAGFGVDPMSFSALGALDGNQSTCTLYRGGWPRAGLGRGLRSLLPTEGARPGSAQPWLGQRDQRGAWRPGCGAGGCCILLCFSS